MATSRSRATLLSLVAAASLLPSTSWAFDCKDIAAGKVQYNFGKLAGPHVVHWSEDDAGHEKTYKYNFTIDICDKLKWHTGGSLATECHHGARGKSSSECLCPSTAIKPLATALKHELTQDHSLRYSRRVRLWDRKLHDTAHRHRRNVHILQWTQHGCQI